MKVICAGRSRKFSLKGHAHDIDYRQWHGAGISVGIYPMIMIMSEVHKAKHNYYLNNCT